MFAVVTSLSKSDNADIFLNQLIQFYPNNATNLHDSGLLTYVTVLENLTIKNNYG